MRVNKRLIPGLVIIASSIAFLPFVSSAEDLQCSADMGEYGYDVESRTRFVQNTTVTSKFLALVGCLGEVLPSSHTFRIAIGGYACRAFTRAFPKNPSGYSGAIPEGYKGSIEVTIDGIGAQVIPIHTSPKRHDSCGKRRKCRRELESLTRREKSKFCSELESQIQAPRSIIIIGK